MLGKEDKCIELTEFNGIWARGNPDEVPANHALDVLNMTLNAKGKAITRFGTNLQIPVGNHAIQRWFQSGILPAPVNSNTTQTVVNTLFLDILNHIYSYNGSSSTLLYTLSGMTDATFLNAFNRTFFGGNIGRFSIKRARLQIYYNYNNSFICRDAAGPAPRSTTSNFTATQSGAAGDVPVGIHQFAVLYQTDTGFQTQPGPKVNMTGSPYSWTVTPGNPTVLNSSVAHGLETGDSIEITGATFAWGSINDFWFVTYLSPTSISVPLDSSAFGVFTGTVNVHGIFTPASLNCDGVHAVTLSNIPTGPSYVVQRVLLATQAGGTEFFFIPNGIISDNTTTTIDVDFFDTDLVASADALFDLFEVIPGCTGMVQYAGRIILVGCYFYFNTALVSNVSDPESFSSVSGFTEIPTESDGNNLVSVFVLRNVLYLCREIGFWATQDNGGDPDTWPINIIDATVGSYQNSLCSFTTTITGSADSGDIILLGSKEGVYIFDGVVRRPELTFKVQDLYSLIPLASGGGGLNYMQVCQSVWTHQIFISVPDSSGNPAYLLVGDYDPLEGILDPIAIRWSRYVLPYSPDAILTSDTLYIASKHDFGSSSYLGGITKLNSSYQADYDPAVMGNYASIDAFYQTALVSSMLGWVNFFKAIRIRGTSTTGGYAGNIQYTLENQDATITFQPPPFVATKGQEFLTWLNFVAEKMSVVIECNYYTAILNINRVEIFALPRWQVRPT